MKTLSLILIFSVIVGAIIVLTTPIFVEDMVTKIEKREEEENENNKKNR